MVNRIQPFGGRIPAGTAGIKKKGGFQQALQDAQVSFSSHATKRMASRNIKIDGMDMKKLTEAVSLAKNKGSRETLVVFANFAVLVSPKNNTVITALSKDEMQERIFTQIDSTVIIK